MFLNFDLYFFSCSIQQETCKVVPLKRHLNTFSSRILILVPREYSNSKHSASRHIPCSSMETCFERSSCFSHNAGSRFPQPRHDLQCKALIRQYRKQIYTERSAVRAFPILSIYLDAICFSYANKLI
jgi:hypothetical protein